MASYNPTSQSFANGVISIDGSGGTDYQTIQNAISGGVSYAIQQVYIKSNAINQLLQNIGFQRYNVNGNIKSEKVVPTVDPYSYQSSLLISMPKSKYILDGRLNINYTMLGSETVFLYLKVKTLQPSDILPKNKIDKNISDFLKTYDFFEGYNEELSE